MLTYNLTKQKICYYTKKKYGFAWYLPSATDSPACKCIMAIDQGMTVTMDALNDLWHNRIITNEEWNAVCAFDGRTGSMDNLETIKNLANKLKIKMVLK